MMFRNTIQLLFFSSLLGIHHQADCSETATIVSHLQNAAPMIEQIWEQECKQNSAFVDNITDLLPCYLSFKELIYLKRNGAALLVTGKALLANPTKVQSIDATMQSIIKKIWLNREALFKAMLVHLSINTRTLLSEKQSEIFMALQTALQENGLL